MSKLFGNSLRYGFFMLALNNSQAMENVHGNSEKCPNIPVGHEIFKNELFIIPGEHKVKLEGEDYILVGGYNERGLLNDEGRNALRILGFTDMTPTNLTVKSGVGTHPSIMCCKKQLLNSIEQYAYEVIADSGFPDNRNPMRNNIYHAYRFYIKKDHSLPNLQSNEIQSGSADVDMKKDSPKQELSPNQIQFGSKAPQNWIRRTKADQIVNKTQKITLKNRIEEARAVINASFDEAALNTIKNMRSEDRQQFYKEAIWKWLQENDKGWDEETFQKVQRWIS